MGQPLVEKLKLVSKNDIRQQLQDMKIDRLLDLVDHYKDKMSKGKYKYKF